MIRFSRAFSAACLVIAAPGIAAPNPDFQKMSAKEARIVLRDYARCVVKQAPDEASRAVVEDWDGSRIVEGRSKLFARDCVTAAGFIYSIRANGESLRAALAEELIARDPGGKPGTDVLQPLAPLAFHAPRPVRTTTSKGGAMASDIIASQRKAYDIAVGRLAGQQVAECVVRTHPDETRALLATELGGDAEMAALQALTPNLGACVPKDQKIAFDRASLRADFALSYYRLLMASRGVAWAGEPNTNGASN